MWIDRIVWLSYLVAVTSTSYYSRLCSTGDIIANRTYDVTNKEYYIHSHNYYGYGSDYPNDYRRCIDIYTNNTDHVIKLEEVKFQTEGCCSCDFLEIFYTSMDNAEPHGEEGTWCGGSGPGTKYSDSSHMFLYFATDYDVDERGFEFYASSIHKDDVPFRLSTGAIVGIVFGVLALIAIIVVIVVFVLIQQKKKREKIVHPALVDPPPPARATTAEPANRNVVASTSTMCNRRQLVGGSVPPPRNKQQPPLYQNSDQMKPTVPPVGRLPPLPPQLVHDPAYPSAPQLRQQLDIHPPAYDNLN